MPTDNCGHDRQRREDIGTWVTIIAPYLLDYNQVFTLYSSLLIPDFFLLSFHQLSPFFIVFTQQTNAEIVHEEFSLSVVKFLAAHPKMKQDTKKFVSSSDQHSSCRIRQYGQNQTKEYDRTYSIQRNNNLFQHA